MLYYFTIRNIIYYCINNIHAYRINLSGISLYYSINYNSHWISTDNGDAGQMEYPIGLIPAAKAMPATGRRTLRIEYIPLLGD